MLHVLLLTAFILIISLALMATGILIRKNGKFPDASIERNKEMRKKGIHCARHEELQCRKRIDGKTNCHCETIH